MLINLVPSLVIPNSSTAEFATPWFSMDGANGFHAQVTCLVINGTSPIYDVVVETSLDQTSAKKFNGMALGADTTVLMKFTAMGTQQETVAANAPQLSLSSNTTNKAAVGAPLARLVFALRSATGTPNATFAVVVNTFMS